MKRIMKLKDFYGLMWDRQVAFAVTTIDSFEEHYMTEMSLEDYNIETSAVIFTLGEVHMGYQLDVFIKDEYANATVKAFTITADNCILVAIDFE